MQIDSKTFRPNLFLVGVPKAGSTSLTQWLWSHPEITGGVDEEMRFLMDETDPLARTPGYAQLGLSGYKNLYSKASKLSPMKYIFDATPEYYYQKTAIDVISSIDDSRVIFILRDPVDRILSLFNYAQNNMSILPKEITFHEFIKHVRKGNRSPLVQDRPMLKNAIIHSHYDRFVLNWCASLGRERVHLVFFDKLTKDPSSVMQSLAEDIGLESTFYKKFNFNVYNQSYVVRLQWLHRLQRRTKLQFPSSMRKMLKPLYMRVNTVVNARELNEMDNKTIAELSQEFGDWRLKLSAIGAGGRASGSVIAAP